jgi:fibronectin type 3 domain-containing protein
MVSSFPVLVQTIDSIPPVAPVGLKASIDTTGKVFLSWGANPDQDIYGYRVYRANARHEEFSQVTIRPVADSFYLDQVKLKTLSRKVYYRVMAIDKRQNYSKFSETLEVSRPDVVPPVAPVIQNISSSEKGICLEWVPSSSADVASQVVLRAGPNSGQWQEIYSIPASVTSFCDTLAETGIVYSYTLAAYDETGLKSENQQIVSGKKQRGTNSIELTFKTRRGISAVELNWVPVNEKGKYILYRAAGDDPLMTYTTINQTQCTYTDTKVTPGTTYRYVLKCISEGNIALSNEVVVKY